MRLVIEVVTFSDRVSLKPYHHYCPVYPWRTRPLYQMSEIHPRHLVWRQFSQSRRHQQDLPIKKSVSICQAC